MALTCEPALMALIEPPDEVMVTDSLMLLNGAATFVVAGALALTVPTFTPCAPDSVTLALGQDEELMQLTAVALTEVALSTVLEEILTLVEDTLRFADAVTLAALSMVDEIVPALATRLTLPVVVTVLVVTLVPLRLTLALPD